MIFEAHGTSIAVRSGDKLVCRGMLGSRKSQGLYAFSFNGKGRPMVQVQLMGDAARETTLAAVTRCPQHGILECEEGCERTRIQDTIVVARWQPLVARFDEKEGTFDVRLYRMPEARTLEEAIAVHGRDPELLDADFAVMINYVG